MTVVIFFAILIVLILVHEFGHFIVAKKSGIRVDEFGIGFPPKIFGKKIGETEYTVNLLPLGGFVSIWGENPTDEDYVEGADKERSFVQKPRYIQAAVLVAGVCMNILFAFFLYTIAFTVGMPTQIDETVPYSEYTDIQLFVTGVLENAPAFDVLKPNDELLALHTNSAEISKGKSFTPETVSNFISASNGDPVVFEVSRRGEKLSLPVQPSQNILEDKPETLAVGFSMLQVGVKDTSFVQAILDAGTQTYDSFVSIFFGLSSFFAGFLDGSSDFSQVSGPVGIVGLVGDATALGFIWVLTFSAFISLNLAVINLLPFPALDGGRVVFVIIESIIRRPIKPIIATRINQFGFIALLTLMAIVTVNDVIKIF
jgi:regulator of sigma E protease